MTGVFINIVDLLSTGPSGNGGAQGWINVSERQLLEFYLISYALT